MPFHSEMVDLNGRFEDTCTEYLDCILFEELTINSHFKPKLQGNSLKNVIHKLIIHYLFEHKTIFPCK
ncbi:hypothetical protein BpHYR1_047850 [Brachionus plicatilis]|uniref:Uncharacterized protein n=1 Tax=Brachionus plicatilis TaxID=10195 RepID=A0A3M7PIG8_BRAPC|nr:hypothetical protein BpHYR1_047850 [Brachionus plicatilis]